ILLRLRLYDEARASFELSQKIGRNLLTGRRLSQEGWQIPREQKKLIEKRDFKLMEYTRKHQTEVAEWLGQVQQAKELANEAARMAARKEKEDAEAAQRAAEEAEKIRQEAEAKAAQEAEAAAYEQRWRRIVSLLTSKALGDTLLVYLDQRGNKPG